MKPDLDNKPSTLQKTIAFFKHKQRLLIALLAAFALGIAGSFFIELSYASNCTSTVCTNGYKWWTSPLGVRICVTC